MSPEQASFLHVANGTSVTMTLEAAGVPGLRSIWSDPLHEGPVPAGLTDEELIEVRRRHLVASEQARAADAAVSRSSDPVNDMRRWREVIADCEAYRELVLWFEHDVFDQLNLIQVLTWVREHLPRAKPVSLICIGSFPGRPAFKGLGELEPHELAPLLNVRVPVTDAQFTLAGRAWEAFRQTTPEALDALRHEETAALPFLAEAISRLLQELPWTDDGLSRTERRLLHVVGEERMSLAQVFARMGEGDRFYTITDMTLLSTADTLSRTSPPFIALDRAPASANPFRGIVSVTDAGRSVLARRIDRVESSGIDRWIGGVHLVGRSGVWRWDDLHQRVARM